MDSLPADLAQHMEAAKRQNQVFSEVLSTYLKALTLLSEGTRGTLAGLGMSETDILKNIDQVLGKMREQSAGHLKRIEAQARVRVPADGAGEEKRQ